jgi:hypothetical protein
MTATRTRSIRETDPPPLPNACGRCPSRWAGNSTSHCGSCHLTFSSPSAFDDHRIRKGPREGTCAKPADFGLVLHDRAGYQVWGHPGDEDAVARLSGHGRAVAG